MKHTCIGLFLFFFFLFEVNVLKAQSNVFGDTLFFCTTGSQWLPWTDTTQQVSEVNFRFGTSGIRYLGYTSSSIGLKVGNSGMMYMEDKSTGGLLDSAYIQYIDLSSELLTKRYYRCTGSSVTLMYGGSAQAELLRGNVSEGYFQNGQKSLSPGVFESYRVVLSSQGCRDTVGIHITSSRRGHYKSVVMCPGDTLRISSPSDEGIWSGLSSFTYQITSRGVDLYSADESGEIYFTDTSGQCMITDTFYVSVKRHNYQLTRSPGFQGVSPDSVSYQLEGWSGEPVFWQSSGKVLSRDTDVVTLFVMDSITLVGVHVQEGSCGVELVDTLYLQHPHRGLVWDTLQGSLHASTDAYPGANYHWKLVNRFHEFELQTTDAQAQIPIPFKGTFILRVTTTVNGREIQRQQTLKL